MQLLMLVHNLYLEFIIVCGVLGLAVTDDGGTARLPRSLHALHTRLCPSGSGSESCFYSQLSMFMKMHDSLLDPVAMRNIGKRSGPAIHRNPADSERHLENNRLDAKDFIQNIGNNPKGYSLQNERQRIDPVIFDRKDLFKARDNHQIGISGLGLSSVFADSNDLIYDDGSEVFPEMTSSDLDSLIRYLLLKVFSQLAERQNAEKLNRAELLNNLKGSIGLNKRQIVCPPNVSRSQCYDNAFAYYLKLLKFMEDL